MLTKAAPTDPLTGLPILGPEMTGGQAGGEAYSGVMVYDRDADWGLGAWSDWTGFIQDIGQNFGKAVAQRISAPPGTVIQTPGGSYTRQAEGVPVSTPYQFSGRLDTPGIGGGISIGTILALAGGATVLLLVMRGGGRR